LGSAVDEVVESGILTLINLQQQGFAYVPYVSR
jgi:intracellular sulfur oxidation DsrE/DsrF family protein